MLLAFEGFGQEMYAVVQSLQPFFLSLPWIWQLWMNRRSKISKHESTKNLFLLDQGHTGNLNDTLREEIVSCLLKGIRKSVYINKSITADRSDEESFTDKLLKCCCCSCCLEEENEDLLAKSILDASTIRYHEMEKKGHMLLNKQAIIREANGEVKYFKNFSRLPLFL